MLEDVPCYGISSAHNSTSVEGSRALTTAPVHSDRSGPRDWRDRRGPELALSARAGRCRTDRGAPPPTGSHPPTFSMERLHLRVELGFARLFVDERVEDVVVDKAAGVEDVAFRSEPDRERGPS